MNGSKGITEVYLGDGLYASFDGWQICLRAPREDDNGQAKSHFVYLSAGELAELIAYAQEKCWPGAPGIYGAQAKTEGAIGEGKE